MGLDKKQEANFLLEQYLSSFLAACLADECYWLLYLCTWLGITVVLLF